MNRRSSNVLSPMSFLPSDNHALAVDLWLAPYNTIIEQRCNISQLHQWQRFPTSLNHLVEWADVTKHPTSTDNARDRILVYKTLPASDSIPVVYPVSVRLFGFLEDFCLADYGNWKGYVFDTKISHYDSTKLSD